MDRDIKLNDVDDNIDKIMAEIDQFQLTYVINACDKILTKEFDNIYKVQRDDFKEHLCNAIRRNEKEVAKTYKELLNTLELVGKYSIYVDYGLEITEDSARVVTSLGNFIILLPRSLAVKICKNGIYDIKTIRKLSEIITHELGHIVLHNKQIMRNGLNGSKNLGDEYEKIADEFSEKLLIELHNRNKTLRQQCGSELYV